MQSRKQNRLRALVRSCLAVHAATSRSARRCSLLDPHSAPTKLPAHRLAPAPPIQNHPQTPALRTIANNAEPCPPRFPQTWAHSRQTLARTRSPAAIPIQSPPRAPIRPLPTALARAIPQLFLT